MMSGIMDVAEGGDDCSDPVAHGLSTNDINLKVMEYLDVTSLAQFGAVCRSIRKTLKVAMIRRSQRIRSIEKEVNCLLNGPDNDSQSPASPNDIAFFPTLDQIWQASDLLSEAVSLIEGCLACQGCSANAKFPLFTEERGSLCRHAVDIDITLRFFTCEILESICKNVVVRERDVRVEEETSVLIIRALDANYMGDAYRNLPAGGGLYDIPQLQPYWETAEENGTFRDFNRAAHELLTKERVPAFRIAARRYIEKHPARQTAFCLALELSMQALGYPEALESEQETEGAQTDSRT